MFDYSADAFQATIDIKPDYDFGNNNLGVYYARKNKPEDLAHAEENFRRALMSNQRYADAFNNLGIILAREGKLDEAVIAHRRGLEVRIDRASDHNNLCRVYMQKYDFDSKQGKSENAKVDLDNAIQENTFSLQCDPNFLGAWMSRAEIYIRQNDLDQAVKCIQKMIAIDAKAGETLQIQFQLAGKLIELGQSDMATKHLDEAARHFDEAIGWLGQVLQFNPLAADVYNARGIAYLLKADVHRARQDFVQVKNDLLHAQQDFKQVLTISPNIPGARERLDIARAQLANLPK